MVSAENSGYVKQAMGGLVALLKAPAPALAESESLSLPWKRPEHLLTGFWEEWLQEAFGAGYLSRRDIIKACCSVAYTGIFCAMPSGPLRHAIRAA